MKSLALTIALVALFALVSETLVLPNFDQLVWAEDFSWAEEEDVFAQGVECSEKIAIIGSGITGAVAAYKLYEGYRLRDTPAERPCITVFERNSVVGGRLTQAYVYDDALNPIDTCAATFSLNDQCISEAATNVGLLIFLEELARVGTGVWNGKEILGFVDDEGFRNPLLWSFYKRLKWFDRYKNAPDRFDLNATEARLTYDAVLQAGVAVVPPIPGPGVDDLLPGRGNLSAVLLESDVTRFLQSPLCYEGSFQNEGDLEFFREAIFPGMRERFFIDGPDFTMLELFLGFEEEFVASVQGGNLRLIDRLLKISGADVRLNTVVENIQNQGFGSPVSFITSNDLSEGSSKTEIFDTVVLATSLDRSDIEFDPPLESAPGLKQEYTDSFVTHFTTPSLLSKEYFKWSDAMPQRILTFNEYNSSYDSAGPSFFSLTLLRQYIPPGGDGTELEYLYKLVSRDEIPDTQILKYLDLPPDNSQPIISWMHREPLYKSVPIEPLDKENPCRSGFLEKIEITPGLFYAGGGEQVIPSAEFGCRMARNVANLILNGEQEV